MTMGDRVAVLKDGILQQVDSPRNMYDRPRNVFVAGFIGSPAMNLLTLPVNEQGVQFGSMILPIERSALSKASGNKVTVGVRPEDLDISGSGQGLPVQVDVVEELGADAYIYGTTSVGEAVDIDDPDLRGEDATAKGGDNIIARTDGRRPPTRGETVHLVPSGAGHVHFFDIASGARLDA
jgi:multiple sugar transport system ATP-binding protein